VTKEEEFWSWVKENRKNFVDESCEKYLDEFLMHLHIYDENLFFEIGGNDDEREIIITALGNKEHFDSVYKLVGAAPVIEHWKITALKPAVSYQDRQFIANYYGVELNTEKMNFIPLVNSSKPNLMGLRVLVNNFDQLKYETFYEGAVMVINTIVGEKVAAEDINYIEVMANDNSKDSYAMTDLPDYINWRKSK
jgi:hypothetical protein